MQVSCFQCGIRQEHTDWAGGVYKVTMEFTEDYPSKVYDGGLRRNHTFDLHTRV